MNFGYYGYKNSVKYDWSGSPTRNSENDIFNLNFSSCNRIPNNFKEECIHTATLLKSAAGNRPINILLSGGSDSEVVARSFLDAEIEFTPVFFKYKRYLWDDLFHAERFCKEKNLKLKVMTFDEDIFFNNKLAPLAKEFKINEPFAAFDIERLKQLKGFSIFGTGDIVLEWNSVNKSITSLEMGALSIPHVYLSKNMRDDCYQFFQYTPELLLSYLNEPIIRKWIELAPEIGFQDLRYFKYHMFKKHWPDLVIRNKYYGYERFADQYFKAQEKLKIMYSYKNERPKIDLLNILKQLDPKKMYSKIDGPK